jgi:peptidoglycan/LPS O-acetylase OafA/YrhL
MTAATTSKPNPSNHQKVTMNRTRPFRPVRRLAGILAALAAALLAAAPAVIAGGMPGWQIALIAVAAAVVAAAVAVFLDRARAARRHHPAPSA